MWSEKALMMLVLAVLALAGIFAGNYLYGDILLDHKCMMIDCTWVKASGVAPCPPTVWCASSFTAAKFPKCYPQNTFYCNEDSSYGSITCPGTCQDRTQAPCLYTLNFCPNPS
jgi:hypothetical protein